MNDDTTINRVSTKHAYQQVADAIAARIAANQYLCKLPRELHLAEEFGVSQVTVRHAMAILRERGLIVSIHGRGTFIASESDGNQSEISSLYISLLNRSRISGHKANGVRSYSPKAQAPQRPA